MLVNLPKKIVCNIIGRELMRYSVISDPDTHRASILVVMGELDVKTTNMTIKYYPLESTEPFLENFRENIESKENRVSYIAREIVNSFYSSSDELDNDTIIKYCKLITDLNNFTSSHDCSVGSYTPPINIVTNEDASHLNVADTIHSHDCCDHEHCTCDHHE